MAPRRPTAAATRILRTDRFSKHTAPHSSLNLFAALLTFLRTFRSREGRAVGAALAAAESTARHLNLERHHRPLFGLARSHLRGRRRDNAVSWLRFCSLVAPFVATTALSLRHSVREKAAILEYSDCPITHASLLGCSALPGDSAAANCPLPATSLTRQSCPAAPCRELNNNQLTGSVPPQLSVLSSLEEL